ncbi:hypothetical protein QF117_15460 [Vibrio sp. YMD68]|uniref:hypothetical protein n=1 Tax=Vibrio sp. YMD68 TaxID=3042300 RepID=UPI00249B7B6E|nr:hypothetical protein [Vibrio sp. YMD68]WGV99337.1 hypothetical protein QF117_15460 [Vibrio sp. YMD68]
MKKTILALTIATTIPFVSVASAAQVDRAVANYYTEQVIAQQMSDIDDRVLEQLNAQGSQVAVVDNVVYEQHSDGSWSKVGAASLTLVAGILSTSSSSSSSSSEALPVLPNVGEPSLLPIPDTDNPISKQYTIEATTSGWKVTDNETGANALVNENGDIRDSNTGRLIGAIEETNTGADILNSEGIVVATYNAQDGLVFLDVDQDAGNSLTPKDQPIFEQFSIEMTTMGWKVTDNHTGANALVDDKGTIRDSNTGEVIGQISQSSAGANIHNSDGVLIATYNQRDGLVFLDVDQDAGNSLTPKDQPIFEQFSIEMTTMGWKVTDNHTGANALVDDKGTIRDSNTGEVIGQISQSSAGANIHNSDGVLIATYNQRDGLVFLDVDQDAGNSLTPKDQPIFEQFSIEMTTMGWKVTDNHTGANALVDDKGTIRDSNTGEVIGQISQSSAGANIHNSDGVLIATYNQRDGLVFLDIDHGSSNGKTFSRVVTDDQHERVTRIDHVNSEASAMIVYDKDAPQRSTITVTDRNGNELSKPQINEKVKSLRGSGRLDSVKSQISAVR